MVTIHELSVTLAQTTTETGEPSQTSWWVFVVLGIITAFVVAAVFVRRARRARGDAPAGSVPASEVSQHLESGRMTAPPPEAGREY